MATYYATTSSLQTLMIGTTFDTITTALASKCITMAENEINKALTTRYDVSDFYGTNGVVPPMVTSWCEQLAVGYMYRFMSRGSDSIFKGAADNLVKPVLEELKALTENKISLVDTSGSQITGSIGVLCNTDDYVPTFNEDDPLDWSVDSDKLDDIEDERS